MFFVLLRPIFSEKWKRAPPIRKEPPSNVWICEIGRKITLNFDEDLFFLRSPNFGRKKPLNFGFRPKNLSEFWRRPFFFGDHLILSGKKPLNFGFRPKNHSEFWQRPFFFFFWRSPIFGRKKPLNFRDISSQFSDKPSETDSRSMKIRVKVVCTLLTLSK